MVYQGKEETINSLVDGKYMILDSFFENKFENSDVEDSETKEQSQTKADYTKFRQFFENGDKELVEKLKRECELVLFK